MSLHGALAMCTMYKTQNIDVHCSTSTKLAHPKIPNVARAWKQQKLVSCMLILQQLEIIFIRLHPATFATFFTNTGPFVVLLRLNALQVWETVQTVPKTWAATTKPSYVKSVACGPYLRFMSMSQFFTLLISMYNQDTILNWYIYCWIERTFTYII